MLIRVYYLIHAVNYINYVGHVSEMIHYREHHITMAYLPSPI